MQNTEVLYWGKCIEFLHQIICQLSLLGLQYTTNDNLKWFRHKLSEKVNYLLCHTQLYSPLQSIIYFSYIQLYDNSIYLILNIQPMYQMWTSLNEISHTNKNVSASKAFFLPWQITYQRANCQKIDSVYFRHKLKAHSTGWSEHFCFRNNINLKPV